MSEIFKWLKKTELEQKGTGFTPSESYNGAILAQAADAIEDTISPNERKIHPASTTIGHSAPVKPEIRSHAAIDLDAADYRIRDVCDSKALVGEQFRLLRAKLDLIQKQRGIKKLLITSAIPGEGKTYIACGLAAVLAQESEKRALLIDGDLRNPAAGRRLGLNDNREMIGLADVLRGEAEAIEALQSSNESNLYFLPAGNRPSNPAELLSSSMFPKLLNEFAKQFDWIIIDSPPSIVLADISIIAPACDAVVLVIQSSHTPARTIKECINQIGREKICGVVLNRLKKTKGSRYYYQYYQHSSDLS
jgi:protein-tyrosine kinase